MGRSANWLLGIAGLALWALVFGFVLFANTVTREQTRHDTQADGIVVFTGEGVRIKEAARLLRDNRARKLLISGVHPKNHAHQLIRLTGLTQDQFDCCVTLGYDALNTLGNVSETRTWAQKHNLRSLIVVTATYHMPRAMAELSLAMPETQLIPHDVLPTRFRKRAWWLHAGDIRILMSEYLKYIPSAARCNAKRVVEAWTDPKQSSAPLTAN